LSAFCYAHPSLSPLSAEIFNLFIRHL
jgi:hypothetical protein